MGAKQGCKRCFRAFFAILVMATTYCDQIEAQLVLNPLDPDAAFPPNSNSSNSSSSNSSSSTDPSNNTTVTQPPTPSNPINSSLHPKPQNQTGDAFTWLNPNLPLSQRVSDLIAQMTLQEKLGLMAHGQQAVPRLGVPAYNFWTECLHGHQEQGSGALPTVFPQPVVLASTWDEGLAKQVFTAISDEMRAKDDAEYNKTGKRRGLICWSPHINIFRDPRWGRGSETFGEDPLLTARMATRVVQGLQGSGDASSGSSSSSSNSVKKVIATCKHFLGYSLEGAEGVSRYSHNIELSPQDMTDTELPPFQACVQAAGAQGVMCSYNSVNGTPSCANDAAINGLLRQGLGFNGYVVSDCNAVSALTWGHRTQKSLAEASAASLKAGVDIFCDRTDGLTDALAGGLITEADLNTAINRTLTARFKTGQFDPAESNPWGNLTLSTVNSRENRALARQVVQKGTVLLKNTAPVGALKPILPLVKENLQKLCVLGPLSNSVEHMMGNYYGKFDAAAAATPLKGVQDELAGSGVVVQQAYGMDILGQIHYDWPLESALQVCDGADAAIVVVGSSMIDNDKDAATGSYRPATEGEGLDRVNLALPGRQGDLVKALATRAPGLPLVVVVMHGGGLDIGWMRDLASVNAIVAVGFPGQEGGRGIADVLFGNVNPSGRLPITWYYSNYTDGVSPLDVRMRPDRLYSGWNGSGHPGRSYRFLVDPNYVLYPFGSGLSYTSFSYSNLKLLRSGEEGCVVDGPAPTYCFRVTVTNTGDVSGEHIVPLYLSHLDTAGIKGNPLQSLRAFARTQLLNPSESQELQLTLGISDFVMPRHYDGRNMLHLGPWRFSVGSWDAPVVPAPATGFTYSGLVSSSIGSLGFKAKFSSGDLGGSLASWIGESSLKVDAVDMRDSQVGAAIVAEVMLDPQRKLY